MAQTKYLYEVLIRGTKEGKISGAHQIWATSFSDDETGEEIAVKHGAATVLDPADVKALVSEQFVGLANQVVTMTAEAVDLAEKLQAANSAKESLLKEIQVLINSTEPAAVVAAPSGEKP